MTPASRFAASPACDIVVRGRRFLDRAARSAWVLGALSWVAWMLAEAALMSGRSLAEVVTGSALAQVLTETRFGRVWVWRLCVAIALGAAMLSKLCDLDDVRRLVLADERHRE